MVFWCGFGVGFGCLMCCFNCVLDGLCGLVLCLTFVCLESSMHTLQPHHQISPRMFQIALDMTRGVVRRVMLVYGAFASCLEALML